MENNINCRDIIISEEYADFITEYEIPSRSIIERYGAVCYQALDVVYSCVYVPLGNIKELSIINYPYKSIPTLYGLMDTVALEESGILKLQNQPNLQLKGNGVMVGIIDTGIDYTHKAFRDSQGNTRILKIWDQTDNSGNYPERFGYGSEYTKSDIDKALRNENPLDIVPVTDEIGHGTFVAGVVSGSEDIDEDFVGAVPESSICVVKLKPAKKYLRDYYMINDEAPAFQENDIMIGIGYLREQALRFNMPLVIVIGLGSSRGGHNGASPLSSVIESFSKSVGSAIVVAGGNEGDKRLHYKGNIGGVNNYESVEMHVTENLEGCMLELWANNPMIFSVGIQTPSGEVIPKIDARVGESETIYTIFGDTVINIEYALVEQLSGDQIIIIRLSKPFEGIWKINVYAENELSTEFNMWLPISSFIGEDTYFLKPDPDMTITSPGDTRTAITVSSYSARTGAFDRESSRGFLRKDEIKPDISAPGVSVMGPSGNNSYTYKTGTSVAAAITAGAAAQFLNWGVVNRRYELLGNQIIKSYLIRGANREAGTTYPNVQWGYGKLDVYNSFRSL